MTSKLLKKVRGKANLEAAWHVIRENGRTSKSATVKSEIEQFHEDATRNVERLYRRLQRREFQFPKAKGIPLPKGTNADGSKKAGIRPIVLASVESRIVQRAILNVLTDLPALERFVLNPNSFGGMRKTAKRPQSAVPAAIQAVLDAISTGARYAMCADISGFFTRISKSAVSEIVAKATNDAEFMLFFRDAIRVELANMAELRELAQEFPIEDIGVAQGNSLSPLLGNILLHEFDEQMNAGDCQSKRYIDDFLVLGPTASSVSSRMKLATRLLTAHGMALSPGKSSSEPICVELDAVEFLGIELVNGLIRPNRKGQARLLANVAAEFEKSQQAFEACRQEGRMNKSLSLVATLKRVDGIVRGWGKHYRFCNDEVLFAHLDDRIDALLRAYLGGYRVSRERSDERNRRALLGVEQLSLMERTPFTWRKQPKVLEAA